MAAALFLMLAGLGWAWWTGRLKNATFEDGIAGAVFLMGLRLATTGKPLVGLALAGGAAAWAYHRHRPRLAPGMPAEDARKLLGLSDTASLDEIREAHRRLIAKVHPDTGGSAELANRVNVARDVLVAESNKKTPRRS